MVKVNIRNLIHFYDEDKNAKRHASAIKALTGEELQLRLLVYYLRSTGIDVEVFDDRPTEGKKKGKRLDFWLKVKNEHPYYYQVEVKSWSFHSLGEAHARLSVDCSEDELRRYKQEFWKEYWNTADGYFDDPKLNKVLKPMKHPPKWEGEVLPLACLWTAVHPDGEREPWFSRTVGAGYFKDKDVWVFSASGFLREYLKKSEFISLELPDTLARRRYLDNLFLNNTTG